MFHLAANFVAIANVANTDVPALNDDILNIQNGHHIPTQDMGLLMVYSSAVTLLRTRINSPKVRQVAPSFIAPIGVTLLPPTDPNFADYRANPFVMKGQEEIVYESTDSAAGPNNHYIISLLQDRFTPAPVGDIYTIRGTGTTTAVASTWTTAAITWDTQLPAGTYAVVGGQVISTTIVAFQLIFDNQFFRPGGLGSATPDVRPPWWQVNGEVGKWGEFNTVTLPRLRVLCNAADAAQTVLLDIIRIR